MASPFKAEDESEDGHAAQISPPPPLSLDAEGLEHSFNGCRARRMRVEGIALS